MSTCLTFHFIASCAYNLRKPDCTFKFTVANVCNKRARIFLFLLREDFFELITIHAVPIALWQVVDFRLVTVGVIHFCTPITTDHIFQNKWNGRMGECDQRT